MFEESSLLILQLLPVLFLSILFIQSGLDKVFDRDNNLTWLKGHFSNSLFKNSVPFLLITITIIEVIAGFLCLIGSLTLVFTKNPTVAIAGVVLSALALLMLFFGQRLAKDYAGAQSLVSYFILSLLALLFLLMF
ncbi:MAG: DoxX family membrane protein [Flavobacteriales bacterium]